MLNLLTHVCEYGVILNLDIVVELELALVVSIVILRIFGNGVSKLESLSTQLIFA